MVVSVFRPVYCDQGEAIGVVGVDLPLASLLEDVTHFYSPSHSYIMAMNSRGLFIFFKDFIVLVLINNSFCIYCLIAF